MSYCTHSSCATSQVLDTSRCDQLCKCMDDSAAGQVARVADDGSPLAGTFLDATINIFMTPFRLVFGSSAEPQQTADAPMQPVSVPLPRMLFQFLSSWLRYAPHRDHLCDKCAPPFPALIHPMWRKFSVVFSQLCLLFSQPSLLFSPTHFAELWSSIRDGKTSPPPWKVPTMDTKLTKRNERLTTWSLRAGLPQMTTRG